MSDYEERSIWDHFEELSSRLRRIVIALLVTMIIVMSLPSDLSKIAEFDFSNYTFFVSIVIEVIQESLLPEEATLIAFNWLDSFNIYVIVSFFLSFIICLPYTATQIYAFLSPALYEKERKSLLKFVLVFVFLFSLGVLYAYLVLVPATFTVLYKFVNQTRVMPFYSVKDFFDLVILELIGSGLFYTFPLILYTLVIIDLIIIDDLRSLRKHIFIGLAIITAFLTPDPTPISMILMTVPFYIIYELTIIILSHITKKKPDPIINAGLQSSLKLLEKESKVNSE
jgi:sec-independent protein translocase protein TatC